ncbi:MAG: hypothetical protein P8I13_00850, partial [Porticoccaceae bacterium]|nr:hypothetical protein [Porticoccaceae bacterium]
VDYYVIESTRLDFYLISPGQETFYALDVSTTGQWNSVQIPLSHYESVVDLTDAFQFKVDGDGSVAFNNLYFGGTASTDPVDPVDPVDTDGDGVVDADDAYPNNPSESADTDNDGVGDNADFAPNDEGVQVDPANPNQGVFSEAFGGTAISGDSFTFPTGAEGWGGFANMNDALYPITFTEGGTVTFNGSVPSGVSADVRFRFEYQPHPNVDPSYDAETITVSGATPTEYTVAIPSQGDNTFSSMIMYVVDRDIAVNITDISVNSGPAGPSQIVTAEGSGMIDGSASVTVTYDVTDGNANLTGLGLRVHFDSTVLTYIDFADQFATGFVTASGVTVEGTTGDDVDANADTDRYVSFSWASFTGLDWPGALTQDLVTVNFSVADDDLESTLIGFSSSSSPAGYSFSGADYELPLLSGNLDFDQSGTGDALTDGLLLLRYAFGLRGSMLTAGAVAGNSPLDSAEVEASVANAAGSFADIDGNGRLDALTDGLILLRYLFGLRGTMLTSGAIAGDATRTTPEVIESYVSDLLP